MKRIKVEKIAWEKGYYVNGLGEVYSKWRQLSLNNYKGYLCFTIRIDDKPRRVNVHRMQAYQKFKDKIYEDNIVVRHLNGNSLDNTFNNIGIGSQSENMFDRPREERTKHGRLAASFNIKYPKELIDEMKTFYNNCKSYKQTMEKYNLSSKGTLWHILKAR